MEWPGVGLGGDIGVGQTPGKGLLPSGRGTVQQQGFRGLYPSSKGAEPYSKGLQQEREEQSARLGVVQERLWLTPASL